MRIEDHTSGCEAHMAALAGKLFFLGNRGLTHCAWVSGCVVGVVLYG